MSIFVEIIQNYNLSNPLQNGNKNIYSSTIGSIVMLNHSIQCVVL
jgi:hypothetical protein